jgi:hypothetical protein
MQTQGAEEVVFNPYPTMDYFNSSNLQAAVQISNDVTNSLYNS